MRIKILYIRSMLSEPELVIAESNLVLPFFRYNIHFILYNEKLNAQRRGDKYLGNNFYYDISFYLNQNDDRKEEKKEKH